jgi:hypothetical protein
MDGTEFTEAAEDTSITRNMCGRPSVAPVPFVPSVSDARK